MDTRHLPIAFMRSPSLGFDDRTNTKPYIMSWMTEPVYQSLAIVFVLLALVSFAVVPTRDKEQAKFWSSLGKAGVRSDSRVAWWHAAVQSITSTVQNAQDGYTRFCKAQNLPFALPSMWAGGAVVVLPQSLLHLLNRPDGELKSLSAQLDTFQLYYMIADRDVCENVFPFEVVRKALGKNEIGGLADMTAEEIKVAFEQTWGTQEQFKTVNGWEACGRVVTRAALLVLIGPPICRDERLLEQSRKYINCLFGGAAMINCLPPPLRPLVGPLVALPAKYYQARCQKILVPYVKERIRMWENPENGEIPPDDFLQKLLVRCREEGPKQMIPSRIAMRLLALQTMFVFGMEYVFAHVIFDLIGSPSREEFVEGLRDECERVSDRHHGLSSKEAVDELYRVDSTLRESTRFSDFGVTSMARDVGVKSLDIGHGIQLPRGTRVVFPMQPIHHDASIHEDPYRFDAFRFARAFEGGEGKARKAADQRELFTTVDQKYLGWGYGRHACPGRWFASQTLKQVLAHALVHYDVELAGGLEERKAMMNMMIPPAKTLIRIRRRK